MCVMFINHLFMKRLISILFAFILLGAGCASSTTESTVAQSTWFLTRVDEQPLYAFRPYWQARVDFPSYPERSRIDGNDRVWLQNVAAPVRVEDYPYKTTIDYYEGDDWIVLDTIAFDPKSTMPSSAELRQIGGKTIGVIPNGTGAFTMYFLKTDGGLFQIIPYHGSGVSDQEVEALMGQLEDNT